MKQKRIENQDLLTFIHGLPCLVCNQLPSDPDHVTTRGSGGGDTADNCWPICRPHHIERHSIGLLTFIRKYPHLKYWLEKAERHDVLDQIIYDHGNAD